MNGGLNSNAITVFRNVSVSGTLDKEQPNQPINWRNSNRKRDRMKGRNKPNEGLWTICVEWREKENHQQETENSSGQIGMK